MPAARNAGAKMTTLSIVSTRRVLLPHQPLTQHDLNIESDIVPRVIVEYDAPDVANTLGKTSATKSDHISPCLVSDAKVELEDERETEEASEEGIRSKTGIVAIDCVLDGTKRAHFCALWLWSRSSRHFDEVKENRL